MKATSKHAYNVFIAFFIAIIIAFGIACVGTQATSAYADTVQAQTQVGSWMKSHGKWWYKYADGTYPANTQVFIKGKTYSFDKAGWMKIGWKLEDGSWSYYKGSGAMATGWQKVKGVWYYMDSEGIMQTGWQQVSGKWYYLKASGAMATGWVKDKGSWYYLLASGAMKTGWLKSGGKWYYMNPADGKMATGKQVVSGKTYILAPSGAMKTGWVQDGGKWYYANKSGACKTNGWVGNYYLASDGAMATSDWVDNGKYYVDGSGKWVKMPSAAQLATKPGNGGASSNKHVHSFKAEEVWDETRGKMALGRSAHFAFIGKDTEVLTVTSKDAQFIASAAGYNWGWMGYYTIRRCECGKAEYRYDTKLVDIDHLCVLDAITLTIRDKKEGSFSTIKIPSHPCPTCGRFYSYEELKSNGARALVAGMWEDHIKRELKIGEHHLSPSDPSITTYELNENEITHDEYIEILENYAKMRGWK